MSTIAFLVACHFVLNLYYVITVYSVYGEINMMMMMMRGKGVSSLEKKNSAKIFASICPKKVAM